MRPWAATFTPALLDERTLELLCDTLTTLDVWYLREHPEAPLLYASGIRYASDADALEGHPESWVTIPWLIRRAASGKGTDCKNLAAWRCAELRVRHGQPRARCVWSRFWDGRRVIYHVAVQLEDGSVEDPSAILGMHTPELAGVGGIPWNH